MADKNKPGAKSGEKNLTEDAKTAPSTGDIALGVASGPAVSGNATSPDEVSESARLGGQTVEKLKAEPEDQEPAARMGKASSKGQMTLTPNDEQLLVGNSYTATLQLDDKFNSDAGDVVTFMHPAGWDVKASVTGHVASGSFLIERARVFNFGFKVNGKTVASASYETRTA